MKSRVQSVIQRMINENRVTSANVSSNYDEIRQISEDATNKRRIIEARLKSKNV